MLDSVIEKTLPGSGTWAETRRMCYREVWGRNIPRRGCGSRKATKFGVSLVCKRSLARRPLRLALGEQRELGGRKQNDGRWRQRGSWLCLSSSLSLLSKGSPGIPLLMSSLQYPQGERRCPHVTNKEKPQSYGRLGLISEVMGGSRSAWVHVQSFPLNHTAATGRSNTSTEERPLSPSYPVPVFPGERSDWQ